MRNGPSRVLGIAGFAFSAAMAACLTAAGLGMAVRAAAPQDTPQRPTEDTARPQASQQPTFRSGVDLILVDAAVTDTATGRPIADLGKDDFSVKIDGKPRRIVSLQFTSYVAGTAAAAATSGSGKPAPPFSTNETSRTGPTGREILLVVDEDHLSLGGRGAVLSAARRFLARLSPADRVGLSVIPTSGVAVDFTTNRGRVIEALQHVAGRDQTTPSASTLSLGEALAFVRGDTATMAQVRRRECPGPANERQPSSGVPDPALAACEAVLQGESSRIIHDTRQRTHLTMTSLASLVEALGRRDWPKIVVFLAESLPVPETVADAGDFNLDRQQLAAAASAARTSIFVLRLDRTAAAYDVSQSKASLTLFADGQMRSAGLETISGISGGQLFDVVGNGEGVIQRLALETSASYLLGLEPTPGDRDGASHRVEVRVNRRGLAVRARSEFTVRARPAPPASPAAALASLLASPAIANEVPIRLTTYNVNDAKNGKVRLLISAEVGRNETAPREMTLAFLLRDQQDHLFGSSSEKRTLEPLGAGGAGRLGYVATMTVPPGSYTLRFAALSGDGRGGSVDHPVEARLATVGDFEVGDLLVVDAAGARDGSWRPAIDPVSADGFVSLFLEVNGRDPARLKHAQVRFEVARREAGPAAVGAESVVQPAEASRGTAQARLAVELLPAGDYVGRAILKADGKELARFTRPLRIVAAARPATTAVSRRERAPSKNTASDLVARAAQEPFRRDDVLSPAFLGRFLDRLAKAAGPRATALTRPIEEARVGHFDAAAELVRDAPPDTPEAPFLRGLALFARNDLNGAAVAFRATLTAAPDFLPAIVYLGACYAAGGHDRDAAGAWETSLISEGSVREIYLLMGDALVRLNDGDLARTLMLEAAEAWPEDVDIKRRLAAAYAIGGNERSALAALAPYLEQHPENDRALFLALGLIYAAHQEGGAIDDPDADRARFDEYAQQYAAAKGPDQALVAEWRRALASGK